MNFGLPDFTQARKSCEVTSQSIVDTGIRFLHLVVFSSTLEIWMRMKHERRIFSHGLRCDFPRPSIVCRPVFLGLTTASHDTYAFSFCPSVWQGNLVSNQVRSPPDLMKDRLNIWRPAIRWIARMNWVGQTSTCPTGTLWQWAKSLGWSEKNSGGEKA